MSDYVVVHKQEYDKNRKVLANSFAFGFIIILVVMLIFFLLTIRTIVEYQHQRPPDCIEVKNEPQTPQNLI